jgi:Uma2 family endonuclease
MKSPAVSLWESIIGNPAFRNLPYKIETNRAGTIMMSPASNWHGACQSQVGSQIRKSKKSGEIINECSILTNDGVKVADVAWASDEFIKKHGYKTPYVVAPEICVEVESPGNTEAEIDNKINLYLAKGAIEVWVVGIEGQVSYFNQAGSAKRSSFVKNVKINRKD